MSEEKDLQDIYFNSMMELMKIITEDNILLMRCRKHLTDMPATNEEEAKKKLEALDRFVKMMRKRMVISNAFLNNERSEDGKG